MSAKTPQQPPLGSPVNGVSEEQLVKMAKVRTDGVSQTLNY